MGAKASTAGTSSSTALASGAGSSDARSRTLSTSTGASDSGLSLLRSASQGASASSGVPGVVGVSSNSVVRERVGDRGRTRSLSSVPGASNGAAAMSIPTLLSRASGSGTNVLGASVGGNSSETEGSSPEDYIVEASLSSFGLGRVFATHSLPAHLWSFNGFKCPVCSKLVLADDLECHLVICLTKPRISYNEDVLCEDKGECVICLEDLSQGDTIARLPCLCIYHKTCIDEWFQVNRSCPEHPYD